MATAPTGGPEDLSKLARVAVERCHELARFTEEPGWTTRTFLSPAMREVHTRVAAWMAEAGLSVTVDAAGNIRGSRPGSAVSAPPLVIGSHLDTVPRAGAFDGVLGVMLGIALMRGFVGIDLPFAVEVIGFSEEEGVRHGVPFIGSRALVGTVDAALLDRRDANGHSVADAIRAFGLDPAALPDARAARPIRYLELHIEQGPVLDRRNAPLAVVDAVVGQSRGDMVFTGCANHAGTTPMAMRRDALAAAAAWIVSVERLARLEQGMVATVGFVDARPGATNVIPGECRASLDVRHADDHVRWRAVDALVAAAVASGAERDVGAEWRPRLDEPAVAMDPRLSELLAAAVAAEGFPVHRLASGAGHDAMIVARHHPAAMLFVRSPDGISHHLDERVNRADVEAALRVGRRFVQQLAAHG